MAAHFNRRAALYRHLGILPRYLAGRTALEVGPGSGFNSLYTASLNPARYVLVEPNPQGVIEIRQLFERYPKICAGVEVVEAAAEQFTSEGSFDFVFCEGVLALAGLPNPTKLLWTVASHTATGGLLVITCIDAVSDFPEVLRRFVAHLIVKGDEPLSEKVDRLLPVFRPHLSTLPGMTRRHDDWIVDNLLSPASIGPLLTIPDAIAALDSEFDVFGASPQFLTDWRWYKSITTSPGGFNDLAVNEYWENVHNLFDYRGLYGARNRDENKRLYAACSSVRDLVRAFENQRDSATISQVVAALETIILNARSFSSETALSLEEFCRTITQSNDLPAALAAAPSFGAWFGRGQQYLSFSRRIVDAEI